MFTGIIEQTGTLKKMQPKGGDYRLYIHSDALDFSDVQLGDSIACNGVCLTVVELDTAQYAVDVSCETLDKTTLGEWQVGDVLNLEKAMLATTRFGGHMVSGHVDGTATITAIQKQARSQHIQITVPKHLKKYIATKGSVTLDGISLTTNLVEDDIVHLNIIPHTAQATNIAAHWQLGKAVNIEVDLVARYLERLIQNR